MCNWLCQIFGGKCHCNCQKGKDGEKTVNSTPAGTGTKPNASQTENVEKA